MANDPVVYVIDDDDAARDSLAFLLGSAQFVVNAYGSAKAFLDALPTLEPGCVISDIRMPETDGLELLKRLKTRNIGWPIILITGHADLPLAIEAIRLGAADLIEKPYDADALFDAVRIGLNPVEMQSPSSRRQKLRRTWRPCPALSAWSWMPSSPGTPVRLLLNGSASANVVWKYIGPIS